MLSYLRKKLGAAGAKEAPAERTFKLRVEEFWTWFAEAAPRIFATIEEGKCASLADEMAVTVERILGGGAWEFGPGANGGGHGFTFSPEDDAHRQFLAAYWLSRAPKLTGWSFFSARQPTSIAEISLSLNGRTFRAIEFWVTPLVDREQQKVDITVWHPVFDAVEERQRYELLFLFLDQALGEVGTGHWIGKIDFSKQNLADAMPLEELRPYLARLQGETGWKKLPPGEAYTGYQCKEPHDRFPRGDTITGTTAHMRLIDDYMKAGGEMDNPLAKFGADFAYVALEVSLLAEGDEAAARGDIEDALDAALKREASGRVLGGAHGTRCAYVDLFLVDGAKSVALVQRVLRERGLPAETSVNFFAKDKRDQRVMIGA